MNPFEAMMMPGPVSAANKKRVAEVITTAQHDEQDVLKALREARDRASRRGEYLLAEALNEAVKVWRKK